MVKHLFDLYPQVHSYENLLLAETTAARGKRGRPDVAAFEYHLDGNLLRLRDSLRAKTYRPGPYRRFTIREPKERVIAAAPFRDRVVHHALLWVSAWSSRPMTQRPRPANPAACAPAHIGGRGHQVEPARSAPG